MTTTRTRTEAPGGSRVASILLVRVVPPAVFAIAVLLLWEMYVRLTGISEVVLPGPSKIAETFWEMRDLILGNISITVGEILIGYLAALIAGIGIALLIRSNRTADRSIHPWLVTLQTVPMPAIAPIFVAWTGFDLRSKILVIAFGSFFPIAINAVDGLRAADPRILSLLRTLGASDWERFVHARIPAALPHIFTGMKISAAFAVVSAVFAEWVGSNGGLGYLLLIFNNQSNTAGMFAVIVVLAAIGMTFFGLLTLLERITIPWYHEERKNESEN